MKFKKVIKPTTKVKGYRMRLNAKSEMKSTDADFAVPFTIPAAWISVWDSNSAWTGPVRMITAPTGGTGANQYIGGQMNAMYCDVRIIWRLVPGQVAIPYELVRFVCVKSRIPGQDNTGYPPFPGNILIPMNTKDWDVQYDKVFTMATGLSDNVVPDTYESNYPPPKYMRFKIPCTETLTLKGGQVILDKPIVIAARSYNAACEITQVHCRFYYRDP